MGLVWNWPQIVWLGLTAAGIAIVMARHGEPRKAYSIWDMVLGLLITVPLLYFGGFWAGATP